MKKVYIIIISISIFVIGSITALFVILNTKTDNKKNNSSSTKETSLKRKEKCKKADEKYNIIFVTNSDYKIDNIETCISCEDKEIVNPSKEGFDFDGWYYESDFKTKISSNKIKDLVKREKKEKECLIGYEDITLYAKWNEKIIEEQPEEIVTNSTQEVLADVQIEEPQESEEQSLPQEQIVEDTVPNICEFKRPVEYGKFINYTMATHKETIPKYNFYIVTNRMSPIYSVTCGKVYFVRTYMSKFNYKGDTTTPERVSDIYTLSYMDGQFISIVYIEVAEAKVKVNDVISNETMLGRATYMSKGIFVHRLPYINIYMQKGQADPYNSRGGDTINPASLISLPQTEFWNER